MWFAPLGDSALAIKLGEGIEGGTLAAVSELAARLRDARLRGVTDIVPAYATVTVFYEPTLGTGDDDSPYEKLCAAITAAIGSSDRNAGREIISAKIVSRRREIPVCYGGNFGPDLAEVALHTNLRMEDVIARHSAAEYFVQAIGFAPGFPYLAGLPKTLETPRRSTPRTEVPAGSVGIGGAQTGIYPMKSPGGWQLIGRTPLSLFDVKREEPAWLRVGDVVTFRAITSEEFAAWR